MVGNLSCLQASPSIVLTRDRRMAVEVINTSACCHSCKIRFADGAKLEFHIKTFHLKMVACKRFASFFFLTHYLNISIGL